MSTVHEIESAVSHLPPSDLAAFRAWFAEFDQATWDRALQTDAANGRLDALAEEALTEDRTGRTTPL